ncbi:hypothetical protein PTTG_05379 [Puccinia triticina 1-1 BBBD Race 1]|uniref:GrpE protein homolog, mitochondrial n=2 Tax=Puccinia triticina TaxID=208348 RepID=A0A0C4EX32_PUCT1|nr:uncharacterized protein PtA15_17A241 [Puccinia triticina]OAV97208.1 hypothetical protein PTTG_05379 [Puccinia triticina 1-1 BBBD Race 1]WAQ92759.1 hypothetical protein PtA15_17A241 [Puccinia triticina]WAR63655.1 hypothetical protein PtB15_17B256 [Puccinia triticina]
MASLLRPTRQLPRLLVTRSSGSRLQPACTSSALPRRFSSTTAGSQAETQDAPAGQTANPQASPSDPNTSAKKAQSVEDQLAQKDAQLSEYKDLYIRARADYENLQKITTREKTQAKEYAIQSFARDLVSNIDVLQLALNSVPEALRTTQDGDGEPAEGRKHLADLWGGVQSTKSLLEKTLARYGVTPFDPTGHLFDPNRHEAMYQAQVPGKEPNSVINCSKVGWMLRDRVLRPAQVGVNQGTDSS